ncbi:hypothetical protein [Herpetosiphon sp. NSE202]|uniref:hypothetical protein n=1 Tax=Herpetosiphon sp. NSE202 TaxID=3351349 RepID=UPI0036356C93
MMQLSMLEQMSTQSLYDLREQHRKNLNILAQQAGQWGAGSVPPETQAQISQTQAMLEQINLVLGQRGHSNQSDPARGASLQAVLEHYRQQAPVQNTGTVNLNNSSVYGVVTGVNTGTITVNQHTGQTASSLQQAAQLIQHLLPMARSQRSPFRHALSDAELTIGDALSAQRNGNDPQPLIQQARADLQAFGDYPEIQQVLGLLR